MNPSDALGYMMEKYSRAAGTLTERAEARNRFLETLRSVYRQLPPDQFPDTRSSIQKAFGADHRGDRHAFSRHIKETIKDLHLAGL